jgi:hypothetical protein
MTTQVTITLSDEVYRRAERFARLANRDLASVLADTIKLSLPPISSHIETLEPISEVSDEQVMALNPKPALRRSGGTSLRVFNKNAICCIV